MDANLAQVCGSDGVAFNGPVRFCSAVRFQYLGILIFQAKCISELRCYATRKQNPEIQVPTGKTGFQKETEPTTDNGCGRASRWRR